MENTRKTGLVIEGGGMKCAYSAGILDAFLDHQISFDYCIGVSGGAGNAATYLAGQRGRNLRFFKEHTRSPKYLSFRNFLKTGNLFGLPYIYGELTNSAGPDPLDFQAILKNPAEYEVAATNAETGTPVYFSKKSMRQDDYRHIMASCAIPGACRPVEIDGVPYYDGGVTDAVPVGRALAKGCDRLVVILSKTRDYVKKPQGLRCLYRHLCRKYPETISAIDRTHITYNRNLQKVFELERSGTAFVFAPSRPVKVGTYTIDEEAEQELYDLGIRDFTERLDELKQFLRQDGTF